MKNRNEKVMAAAAVFAIVSTIIMIVLSLGVQRFMIEAREQAVALASEKSRNSSGSGNVDGSVNGSADGSGSETGSGSVEVSVPERGIVLGMETEPSDYICLPLPEGVSAAGVTAENHYMDGQLWIRMPNSDFLFYSEKSVSGDVSKLRQAMAFEDDDGGVVVRLALDNIYEYELISEDQNLYVKLMTPKEKYDLVVVVDPASDQGAEVNLAVADALYKLMENSGIRVYQTRMTEKECLPENAAAVANAVKADMFIRISVGTDENSGVYGTVSKYSGDYFIPGFSSVDLADVLERSVVTQLRSETLGIVEAGEEDVALKSARVPAAEVVLGYMTNVQENKLLMREDYRNKAAQGIYDAITAAYDMMSGL
ncbi:MAG: N-acetylmuramoyl-L-alanine amidase [Lachnospiraceae bacterium]|nr:N-acetylmuramoyl-L-alanine amidase [Lachnospiraceae bacterium]